MGLTFEDYDAVGVTQVADRRRLFELVHRVREVSLARQLALAQQSPATAWQPCIALVISLCRLHRNLVMHHLLQQGLPFHPWLLQLPRLPLLQPLRHPWLLLLHLHLPMPGGRLIGTAWSDESLVQGMQQVLQVGGWRMTAPRSEWWCGSAPPPARRALQSWT